MRNYDSTELDLVGCPECNAPAEVVDRFVMRSTDGPVEHVKVHCVHQHWFMMAADRLPAAPALPATAEAEPSTGPAVNG